MDEIRRTLAAFLLAVDRYGAADDDRFPYGTLRVAGGPSLAFGWGFYDRGETLFDHELVAEILPISEGVDRFMAWLEKHVTSPVPRPERQPCNAKSGHS